MVIDFHTAALAILLVRINHLLELMFFSFGLLFNHTGSPPITSETHTSGAQYEGSPQNPDQVEQHSCNGPWA